MPTIPLYQTPATPDGWHQVRAPGGYESWHFDAESADGQLFISARFFDGIPRRKYLQQYRKYRLHPTRVAPPTPPEFPGTEVQLHRADLIQRHESFFPPGELKVSANLRDVALADSGFTHEGAGVKLRLDCLPKFQAVFVFDPILTHPACESSLRVDEAEHRWIVVNPLSRVSGLITADGQQIEFEGYGYRDQRFATAPLGWRMTRWICGRILLNEAVCAFWMVRPESGGPWVSRLIDADVGGVRESCATPAISEGSELPEQISFGKVLDLTNPKVLDASGGRIRVRYDADYRNRRGRAVCDIVDPGKLE
jgi:hypothetical protein